MYSNNFEVAKAILDKLENGGGGGGSSAGIVAPNQLDFSGQQDVTEIDLSCISPKNLTRLTGFISKTPNLVKLTGTKNFTAETVKNIKTLQSAFEYTSKLEDIDTLLDVPYTLTEEDAMYYTFGYSNLPYQSIANITLQPSGGLRISGTFRQTKAKIINISNQDWYTLQQNCIANGHSFIFESLFVESLSVEKMILNNTTFPDCNIGIRYDKLTRENWIEIFNALPTTTTTGRHITCAYGGDDNPVKQILTEQDLLIAINKGWTVNF